jgi:DUF917 family protein
MPKNCCAKSSHRTGCRDLGGGLAPGTAASRSTTSDDLVVPVGCIGSTSVLREMLPSGTELPEAVQGLNRWTGTPPAALMPLEMVGVNGLAPLAAASMAGLPPLDADLMGRAFPRVP